MQLSVKAPGTLTKYHFKKGNFEVKHIHHLPASSVALEQVIWTLRVYLIFHMQIIGLLGKS